MEKHSFYKSTNIIFSVNLPLVFVCKFYKKNQIQSPGEPCEQHLGEVLRVKFKSKFNISNRRNFSVNL